ncbi:T5orf172 domain-containing protein [Phaeosphaeria sp. MPI-PUGE-AT-0046c]|nr:T5orf172 domain-containing protein [Phaeosphaeria sp. MPI-PUGE-AT-0046c]
MSIPDPDVNFFVSFYDLEPNAQSQCIYFVKKDRDDRRCKYSVDKKRAIELRNIIIQRESEGILIDEIKEYVRLNCCARAKHQDVVLSSPLLIPLVERWLDEILKRKDLEKSSRHLIQAPTPRTPNQTTQTDSPPSSSSDTSALSATSRNITVETPLLHPLYSLSSSSKASVISNSLQLYANPTPPPCDLTNIALSNTSSNSELQETQKRYNLRPRVVQDSLTQWSRQTKVALLAKFHPYINEPTLEDTVASRLRENLKNPADRRNFETGSVYIYRRESSPGYVKIGWTARTVDARLAKWSECGYTPIEVFRVTGVPYAQRVETLTHHELIKEWRREQPCEGCRRNKNIEIQHQEWFEVSEARAMQVLKTWAGLFKKASLYSREGSLKPEWRSLVDAMVEDNGAITSKRLSEHYNLMVAKTAVLDKKTAIMKEEAVGKVAAVVTEAKMPASIEEPKPSVSPGSGKQELSSPIQVKQEEEDTRPIPSVRRSTLPIRLSRTVVSPKKELNLSPQVAH